MPAGNSNAAVSLEKEELERLVSFGREGTKGKGCLTREGGCHPTLNSLSAALNIYIRKMQDEDLCDKGSAKSPCFRQLMHLSWTFPLW